MRVEPADAPDLHRRRPPHDGDHPAAGRETLLERLRQVADTVLRQGQGMHGSFSRGDTMNFMAAIGPDFKAGYLDELPVSNADIGVTAAKLMGLTPKPKGSLIGRVMTEAMPNGATPTAHAGAVKSRPAENGLRTVLNFQRVGNQRYFDVAGFPGRTLGLEADSDKQKTAGK